MFYAALSFVSLGRLITDVYAVLCDTSWSCFYMVLTITVVDVAYHKYWFNNVPAYVFITY